MFCVGMHVMCVVAYCKNSCGFARRLHFDLECIEQALNLERKANGFFVRSGKQPPYKHKEGIIIQFNRKMLSERVIKPTQTE